MTKMNRLIFFLGCLICGQTQNLFAAQLVVGFGDSITRGWPYYTDNANGASNGSYIPGLQTMLRANNWDVNVLNYGYPGELVSYSLAGALSGQHRIGSVVGTHPDFVVICEGTNDLPHGIGPSTLAHNIEDIVDTVRNSGAVPILASLLPRFDGNFPIATTNSYLKDFAEEEGIEYADFYNISSNWSLLMPDNLHPNTAGYNLLVQAAYSAFEKYRAKKRAAIVPSYLLLLLD